jgi:hypothetical protein
MSAVRAGDSLLAVLSVNGNDGQVYQNVQLSGGSWEGWRKLFGGQSQSVGTLDVASLSTSQITIYNFLMRANGAVYTRRKIGGWSTSWKGWQDLSAPLSSGVTARALSAHHTQGFPVLFLATSNGVKHAWSNDLSGDVWTSWVDLGDGLPSTIKPIDIEAGETSDGKLDVFLLAKPSASEFPQVYRRTKVNNLAGSNWSAWSTYLSVGGSPALKKATAIGLLPPNVFPKGRDNLLLLSDGRVFYSAWTAGGTSRGFLPFYGPKN